MSIQVLVEDRHMEIRDLSFIIRGVMGRNFQKLKFFPYTEKKKWSRNGSTPGAISWYVFSSTSNPFLFMGQHSATGDTLALRVHS